MGATNLAVADGRAIGTGSLLRRSVEEPGRSQDGMVGHGGLIPDRRSVGI